MLSLAAARRRGTALIAVLALLLAQAVGLAHGVAHPQADGTAALSAEREHASNAFDAQHDEGSWQCQLLDQLSHVDGVTPTLLDWTFAAPIAAQAASPIAPRCATCACGYHARGPPILLA
jgi:hypothetical protein